MARPDAKALRRAYARQMLDRAGVYNNTRLLHAFAAVPRERFLGPLPFHVAGFGHRTIASDDFDKIYSDRLFVLDAKKGINNGEPSLHALMIDALEPGPGATVVHAGAGAGYYSAILAECVGPDGRVVAVEADRRLGEMAKTNLAPHANVEVVTGDSAGYPQEPVDGIYVSFAVARPAANWIEGLKPGGRLVLPLGAPGRGISGLRISDFGAVFCIERRGEAFAARFLCPAAFIFGLAGAGNADAAVIAALRRAFGARGAGEVKSLIWKQLVDPDRCWFHSADWSLSYDPPA